MKKLLKDQHGGITSIEFIVFFLIIVFIIFSGVDYFVMQSRYGILEQVKEQTLDRMRIEGWLSEAAENDIHLKLSNMGYQNITIEGSLETSISAPVVRNLKNLETSVVSLTISAQPKEKPFLFGGLIGAEEEGEFYIKVGGEALSERAVY